MITLTLTRIASIHKKVDCIKAFRGLTGFGLRESKDSIDTVCLGKTAVVTMPSNWAISPIADDYMDDLETLGIDVTVEDSNNPTIVTPPPHSGIHTYDTIVSELKVLAHDAIEAGEVSLAISILEAIHSNNIKTV